MNDDKNGGGAGGTPEITPNPLSPSSTDTGQVEVIAETSSPVNQPMISTVEIEAAEAAAKAEEAKKKKSKKGLIIGLIVGFIVLIGGAIGAMFALGVFKPDDPVVVAMARFLEGEKPNNIKFNGTLKIVPKDTTVIRNLSISFDSAVKNGSMINATSVNVDADTTVGTLNLSVDEIYATTNELFLKLKGINDIGKLVSTGIFDGVQSGNAETGATESTEEKDCLEAESETDCVSSAEAISSESMNSLIFAYVLQVLQSIDGEWVRIPLDEIGSTGFTINADTECLADIYTTISGNGNLISEIYKKNSFITSASEDLQITKKANPIYKLVFDAEKTASFSNEIKNSNIIPKNCSSDQTSISAGDIEKNIKALPDIYVEINDKYEFTRLYFNFATDGGTEVEMDLDLAYPATIDIAEPVEYTDLESIFQSQMTDYSEAMSPEITG